LKYGIAAFQEVNAHDFIFAHTYQGRNLQSPVINCEILGIRANFLGATETCCLGFMHACNEHC
jgi:hypothetical protein